ncbi:LysR substrate-binding domain-containing protein [Cupriavidus pauculus]|uniref:LysR substrate-binding domain-containing protein n=1 Tax=Cupriavidus pauculus TaxID=82633 RepID=UPI001EE20866|nr:LysR substrate-binding domain-containing protein [Cupriavidus pauculus]GJG97670.1 LysR family transcriptional regulator [Cupriavidus pauculus]
MRYDIQTLRAFVAVAEEGSIASGAAREATVASAVSKRISEMEQACGVVLINRHRRGVALTPAGVELLDHARRVLVELERLDNTLSDFGSGARGQVRLLANTSSIVQFLPQDFASFIAVHPTVKLDLEERTSDETQRLLLAGLADLGILVSANAIEGLTLEHYRNDRLVVVLPQGHPLASEKKVRFEDVLSYDHVGLPRNTALCDMLAEEAKKLNRPFKLRIQARSYEGLVLMVSAGIGLSLLPERSVTPFLKAKTVLARPLDEPWATRELLLASRENHPLTAVAALLYEHLLTSEERSGSEQR